MRLISFIMLGVFAFFIINCESKDSADSTPPVLKNLAVEFAALGSPESGMAGDFDLTKSTSACGGSSSNCDCVSQEKIFLEFGAEVTGKFLPTFEYIVKDTADVVSPIDGVVVDVSEQSSQNDYHIWIKPNSNSTWTLEVDHVLDVQVNEGDTVTAGQLLGKPGTWSQSGQGRVEIMLFDNKNTAHCPMEYFDEATKSTYAAKINAFFDSWEGASCKNASVYNRGSMTSPGCGCKTMSSSGDTGC